MKLEFRYSIKILRFMPCIQERALALFDATSGFGDHEVNPASQWRRGKGPIPVGEYEVPTVPYPSAKAKSMFYHVTPDPVINPANPQQLRGELGIHADRPPQGSNGCIVVAEDQWPFFEALMAAARKQGHNTLKLIVEV